MAADSATVTREHYKGPKAGLTVRQPDPPKPGELTQTPREIEGPYYRLGMPNRSNLLEPGDKAEFVLTGRVLTEKGTPVPGAIVAVWSSDAVGNYDMITYRYSGYQVCDELGRYKFTTIVPGCYEPRNAKHLHVKVQGNSQPITTQLYVGDEPGNWEDDFFDSLLLIPTTVDADGCKHGVYDFVIKQVTTQENVTPESLAARVDK
jgi:protocatechuate 3,4-dioxygenase alpha subunit